MSSNYHTRDETYHRPDIQYFLYYLFFFNDTATTEIYTLSLHDALPISIFPVKGHSTPLTPGAKFEYEVPDMFGRPRSEEHTSELQSQFHLVCRLLLEKKNKREASLDLVSQLFSRPLYRLVKIHTLSLSS